MNDSATVFKAYFKNNETKYLHKKDYEKIDTALKCFGATPEQLCRYIINNTVPTYLYPNWIHSAPMWTKFKVWLDQMKEQIPINAGLELEAIYTEMNFESDPVKLLNKPSLELSPLVKYVIGKYLGLDTEVEKFRKQASQQLLEYPYYKEALKKLEAYFPGEIPYAD